VSDYSPFGTTVPPYRVEWRPDLTTRWSAHTTADDHDGARKAAESFRDRFKGQTRIISQHVIEVEGLGA
jgi:hypothetical protein